MPVVSSLFLFPKCVWHEHAKASIGEPPGHMTFEPLTLSGAWVIKPDRIEDHRGFFARTWCEREFAERGMSTDLAQCNVSFNKAVGTLRGLHWQAEPHGETKMVRCTSGAIFDVVVDIRPESSTFGSWLGLTLTAENHWALYIPTGFAHGFVTLTRDAEVFYQMSDFFYPNLARGIRWSDETLNIKWPIQIDVVSERDDSLPSFVDVLPAIRRSAA